MSRVAPRRRVLVGDALLRLQSLPTASVDCIITSPPYFNLRHYGAGKREIGQERHVDQWVEHVRQTLHEAGRVLKPTGTLWLNLGDAFSRSARYGAPPKSLLLAPERLLLGLAGDGWLVRNKIVWSKPNPLPTSVRDRLTLTWEPVYLLTRSRYYWFDLDAVRVPHKTRPRPRNVRNRFSHPPSWAGALAAGDQSGLDSLKRRGLAGHPLGKNPGDVWSYASSNYRGAHFATFPEQLVTRPLLAGCPQWVCQGCGTPWPPAAPGADRPGCDCCAPRQRGLVLDPFFGAGTVGIAAEKQGRDWLGIELYPEFAALAEARITAARAATTNERKEVIYA